MAAAITICRAEVLEQNATRYKALQDAKQDGKHVICSKLMLVLEWHSVLCLMHTWAWVGGVLFSLSSDVTAE